MSKKLEPQNKSSLTQGGFFPVALRAGEKAPRKKTVEQLKAELEATSQTPPAQKNAS